MANWDFNANEYDPSGFDVIPAGDHRVRVADIEEKQSKGGNDMLRITLDVSGMNSKLWYYLVLMPDNTKMTNQNIGAFCEAFGLNPPSLQAIENSKGKVGACRVKHETYQGDVQARISYFLNRKKQESLAPWKEPSGGDMQETSAATPFDSVPLPDTALPLPEDVY